MRQRLIYCDNEIDLEKEEAKMSELNIVKGSIIECITRKLTDELEMRLNVDEYLKQDPIGANDAVKNLWGQLLRLNVTTFNTFYERANNGGKIPFEEVSAQGPMKKWKSSNSRHETSGMLNTSAKAHGIIRQVANDGSWVAEKTVNNGTNCGLNRVVTADKVSVFYNVGGEKKATLTFTRDGT